MAHARYPCEMRTKSRYKSKRLIPQPQTLPVILSQKRLIESNRVQNGSTKMYVSIELINSIRAKCWGL